MYQATRVQDVGQQSEKMAQISRKVF